jgi:hypothetical protein
MSTLAQGRLADTAARIDVGGQARDGAHAEFFSV